MGVGFYPIIGGVVKVFCVDILIVDICIVFIGIVCIKHLNHVLFVSILSDFYLFWVLNPESKLKASKAKNLTMRKVDTSFSRGPNM